ncbi:MAG TPA: dipeptidase [Steroidobacteraceae bacterium]|nr:dipeptidase [Steroidobacteraceae bacterium]
MRNLVRGALIAALALLPWLSHADDALVERARRLLAQTILVDGHNDLPWAVRTYAAAPGDVVAYDLRKRTPGQTDIPRLRQGGVGAQFWSVYTPGEAPGNFARTQLEQIELARRIIERYPDTFAFAGSVVDIRAAHAHGRIASLLGMEGGHAIEDSLGALRAYYDLGVRYMTLTHNTHTDWADSAAQSPPAHHGLTPFGEEVVHEMNRLGMLVDLSHVSVETMQDSLRVSLAPVIFSHSAAKALCDVPRNVPDDVMRDLARNGGVLMVTFVSGFIDPEVAKVTGPAIAEYNRRARDLKTDEERAALYKEVILSLKMPATTVAKVADHVEHVRDVAGIEHVGLGGDFDGSDFIIEGLSDVSMYPNLFAELMRRGWSDRDLKLLAGENLLQALGKAEAVAKRLQASTPASTAQYKP